VTDTPRIGVIGLPGKWSSETLADAVAARTGERLLFDMAEVQLDLADNRLWHGERNLCDLDALLVKKISAEYSPHTLDRLELLRVAEAAGVRVFSPALSILRLIDRLSCTVTLRNAGVPMPETRVTESPVDAVQAVRDFGAAVFKPLYSTKARGMCVLDAGMSGAELETRIGEFRTANPVMYIQKKLNLPGHDLGLVFLGGRYLGCYARVGSKDTWNTTIHSGGRYRAFEAPASMVELAEHAQSLFDLDFTTVDIAETADGPVVFEVSAFGGFRGAKQGIGLDAAALYCDYVLEQLAGTKQA
jgi:ribosomal protein S6--L-glutamate ligase